MLRRFESYTFAPGTTDAEIDALAAVLRRTGVFIPEVLDSAVGRNRSGCGVDLVWEHAYATPESYARYMCHPFHICVLDRFLLPEAPECITASRPELQAGLFGYEVDDHPFRVEAGVRRIVLLQVAKAGADSFLDRLRARPDDVPDLWASVVAANTMGLEWIPDGWTHVWEQAYADAEAMRRAVADEAAVLAAGPVTASLDLWYEIERDEVLS